MVRLLKATPVLPALKIRETVQFYERKLGFVVRHEEDEYGIVVRDDIEIHFWKCGDRNIAENSSCRLTVDGVDELFRQAQEAKIVHPNAPIETKPWGMREFAIVDLNGNLVWFLEPASGAKSQS
jgi:catechol 2,3-dioxygenase-like lactoylglutathione lyase family enzyme